MPIAKLADVDLYYEVEGETGPWIVFAHGGGDNHLAWWKQVGALRDRYRCVSYDARWHGRSGPGTVLREADETAAADMLGLMDHLKIDRAFLNGHSMGGLAASGVALAHSARVQGLIMTCTTFGFQTAAMSRWAAEMIEKIPKGFRVLDHSFAPDFERREPELAYLHTALRRLNPPRPVPRESRNYLAAYERMRDRKPESYADFAVPALFILAEQDGLQLPWLVEATAKAVGGAELVRIAGSGHNVHVERPEEYEAALVRFLEKHRG
jgi:pimeloyl-ACP methyl ester carboxylesterase